MNTYQYAILGGGLAAGYAAQTFVEEGGQSGELAIFSAEARPPYERPPLSKAFLAGEESVDDILINAPEFYEENGIDLHLNTRIEMVDLKNRQLRATDGRLFGFEKLMIATGARIRPFDIPGSDLSGLYYLRQVSDSEAIRQAAQDAETAVIIGGSFIGMEVASVLQSSGVQTTLTFPEKRVWQRFFTPEMSDYFSNYYQEEGVTILPEQEIERFVGENGRLTGVVLKSGKTLDADIVVAGIGVLPNSELFAETELQREKNGVLVNRFLETNINDVFAVGDVAAYPDTTFDKVKRIEHWDNAVAQSQRAMKNMLGMNQPFDHLPYFFSDVFDLSYEFWGDTAGADHVIHRGDMENGRFSVWWLAEDGRLLAAFVMDRPEEERELAQTWIKTAVVLNAEVLANADEVLTPVTS